MQQAANLAGTNQLVWCLTEENNLWNVKIFSKIIVGYSVLLV